MQSTSVRIDMATHRELERLAADLGASVGETVAGQYHIGKELAADLMPAERRWLDADLG